MTADLVVLDTDVWSHLFLKHTRRHVHDAEWRRLLVGRTLCIAVQTRAELLAWPEISGWGEQRRALLISQLDTTPTLPVEETVIRQFAHLTADSRRRLGGQDPYRRSVDSRDRSGPRCWAAGAGSDLFTNS